MSKSSWLSLRHFVLSLLISLLIIINPIAIIAPVMANPPTQELQEAQALIQRDQIELNSGDAQTALETWLEATKVYRQLEDEEGIKGGLINQSIALQSLGRYYSSCRLLVEVFELESICDVGVETQEALPNFSISFLNEIGLRSLGNTLKGLGKLELSKQALQKSLAIAEGFDNPSKINQNRLALGNTYRASYQQKRNLYQRTGSKLPKYQTEAIAEAIKTLRFYSEIINESKELELQIQAKVNRLSLWLQIAEWKNKDSKSTAFSDIYLPDIQQEIQKTLDELLQVNSNNQKHIILTANLNFLHHLLHSSFPRFNDWSKIENLVQKTHQYARIFSDKRLESYSLGYLGELSYKRQEFDVALQQLLTAQQLATAINAPDIGFRWNAKLGRVYHQQQQNQKAIAAFDEAIKDLEKVRQQLGTTHPERLLSFFFDIQPIYLELIDLYLDNATQENLKAVLKVYEKLQLAELQNFVQCDIEDTTTLEDILQTEEKPPIAFYTIFLDTSVQVIVHAPQKTLYHYKIDRTELTYEATQLRIALESFTESRSLLSHPKHSILPSSQKIYQLLIAPAKEAGYLTPDDTIVFALDSSLQNIPMAILHDGKHYLVEQYNLAVALGARLKTPKLLSPEQMSAVAGGLSLESPSFAQVEDKFNPLEYVLTELQSLDDMGITRQELINHDFTTEAFQETLNESKLPIIHLATHGKFSSDPHSTYLLAYDEPIRVQALGDFIRTKARASVYPLELLVLSACQTATSDERSALGMAGVALQSGARSTVATLWRISDEETPVLIRDFYEGLKAGKTKAEALAEAQRSMLNNPKYEHPYFWAAFVLAGGWL